MNVSSMDFLFLKYRTLLRKRIVIHRNEHSHVQRMPQGIIEKKGGIRIMEV